MPEQCTNWGETVTVIVGAISTIVSLAIGAWLKIELARMERCSSARDVRLEQVAEAVGATRQE